MNATIVLVPGSVFAERFKVIQPLSAGGMGAVYVAEQLSTGIRRALKLMHPQLVANADLRRRFEQEARVGSRIASQRIVQVVDAGVDAASGAPWIAMELLVGGHLGELVAREGPQPLPVARYLLEELCAAVGAAHNAGIVHRDLKPENIFLCTPENSASKPLVKVLDFGIAKIVVEGHHTHATQAMGTPMWMAPEQTSADGGAISPAADVWSLGLIAFYVLTGVPFWKAASAPNASLTALMREIVLDPIPLPSVRAGELGLRKPLPPGLDAWLARCLDRNPPMRFANAAHAWSALAPVFQGAAAPAVAHAATLLPEAAPLVPRATPAPSTPRLPEAQAGTSPEDMLAADAARGRRRLLQVLGGVATLTALVVGLSAWRFTSEANRKRSVAWSRVDKCLFGGPLPAGKSRAEVFRAERLAEALRPTESSDMGDEMVHYTSGATPWPARCIEPLQTLTQTLKDLGEMHEGEKDLGYYSRALSERSAGDTPGTAEYQQALDAFYDEEAKTPIHFVDVQDVDAPATPIYPGDVGPLVSGPSWFDVSWSSLLTAFRGPQLLAFSSKDSRLCTYSGEVAAAVECATLPLHPDPGDRGATIFLPAATDAPPVLAWPTNDVADRTVVVIARTDGALLKQRPGNEYVDGFVEKDGTILVLLAAGTSSKLTLVRYAPGWEKGTESAVTLTDWDESRIRVALVKNWIVWRRKDGAVLAREILPDGALAPPVELIASSATSASDTDPGLFTCQQGGVLGVRLTTETNTKLAIYQQGKWSPPVVAGTGDITCGEREGHAVVYMGTKACASDGCKELTWPPPKLTKFFTHQDDARFGDARVQLSFNTKGDVFGLAVGATGGAPSEAILDPYWNGATRKAAKFVTAIDVVGMRTYALLRSTTADGFRVARLGLDGKITPIKVTAH